MNQVENKTKKYSVEPEGQKIQDQEGQEVKEKEELTRPQPKQTDC